MGLRILAVLLSSEGLEFSDLAKVTSHSLTCLSYVLTPGPHTVPQPALRPHKVKVYLLFLGKPCIVLMKPVPT